MSPAVRPHSAELSPPCSAITPARRSRTSTLAPFAADQRTERSGVNPNVS